MKVVCFLNFKLVFVTYFVVECECEESISPSSWKTQVVPKFPVPRERGDGTDELPADTVTVQSIGNGPPACESLTHGPVYTSSLNYGFKNFQDFAPPPHQQDPVALTVA